MATQQICYKIPNIEERIKHFLPEWRYNCVLAEGYFIAEEYKKHGDKILDLEIREDDVFVITFPKSGTTWTTEMVWCIANDVDLGRAKREQIFRRVPFLEMSICHIPKQHLHLMGTLSSEVNFADSVEAVKSYPGRRIIKTHLAVSLLPRNMQTDSRKAKIIYVSRDPRDVCVSFYHHKKTLQGYVGDLSTYVKLFLDDKVIAAPYWKHVLEYWRLRDSPNVLFITYEEMKRDLGSVIERVATFLDKRLTPQQVDDLKQHLSFESMKNNPAVNHENDFQALKSLLGTEGSFIRSGQSGGFKDVLTKEDLELFDAWCKKNLGGTDYVLPAHKTAEK